MMVSLWDSAAQHCAAGLDAEPTCKELRDYVYCAEHLSSMLDNIEGIDARTIRVIFDDGMPPEFNE